MLSNFFHLKLDSIVHVDFVSTYVVKFKSIAVIILHMRIGFVVQYLNIHMKFELAFLCLRL
jgi:hypothetical protein